MELFSSLSLKNVMYVVTITFLGINVQGSDVYASLMVLTSISMKENFLASPLHISFSSLSDMSKLNKIKSKQILNSFSCGSTTKD